MARLSRVKLDEISFVGKGDNPEAHVLLLKMKPGEDFTPHKIVSLGKEYVGRDKDRILKGWMESNPDRIGKGDDALTFDQIMANREMKDKIWDMVWTLEDSISSIMCDESVPDKAGMIQQSIDEFRAAITPISKGGNDMPEKLKKELEEAGVKIESLEKQVSDLTTENAVLKEENATLKVEKGAVSIDKSGMTEAQIKKMEEQEARIAKMEDEAITREYIGKAASVSLVGSVDEIGNLLKKVAKTDSETAEKLFGIFKTANARIAEGDLLKEQGADGGGDGSGVTALDQLNKKAAEYKIAHPEVSIEKAFTIVYDTEHDLRKAYLEQSKK